MLKNKFGIIVSLASCLCLFFFSVFEMYQNDSCLSGRGGFTYCGVAAYAGLLVLLLGIVYLVIELKKSVPHYLYKKSEKSDKSQKGRRF